MNTVTIVALAALGVGAVYLFTRPEQTVVERAAGTGNGGYAPPGEDKDLFGAAGDLARSIFKTWSTSSQANTSAKTL